MLKELTIQLGSSEWVASCQFRSVINPAIGLFRSEYTPPNSAYPRHSKRTGQAFCHYYSMKGLAATFILFLLITGHEPPVFFHENAPVTDSVVVVVPQAVVVPVPDTIITKIKKEEPAIETGSVSPYAIVGFAKTLIGTKYLYGSTDPKKGLDCSGFITCVFNHFKIKVPRSSVEFTDVGQEINYQASQPGDIILFTGTDSTIRVVGHMGIVVSNENNKISFIHSTSGKQYGVTITELSPYYMTRFVRTTRVFPEQHPDDAAMARTLEVLNEKESVKSKQKAAGTKKTSSLNVTNKPDTAKNVKSSKSTVKKSKSPVKKSNKPTVKKSTTTKKSTATTKTSTPKKISTAKKKVVKKPVTTTKKSTKKTTQQKKATSTPSTKKV